MGWYRSRGALITATACLLLTPLLLAVGQRIQDERLTRILAAREINVIWHTPDSKDSVFWHHVRNRPQAIHFVSRIDRSDLPILKGLSGIRQLSFQNARWPYFGGHEQMCQDWPLEDMRLHHCELSERDFEYMIGCRRLKSLHLSDCNLPDNCVGQLAELTSLTTLSLRATGITNADCARLSELTGIENLDLSRNGLDNAGLKMLSGYSQLKSLCLQSTNCSPGAIDIIAGFPSLETLRLNKMPLEQKDFDKLTHLPKLRKIGIEDEAAVAKFGPRLPPHIHLTFQDDDDD